MPKTSYILAVLAIVFCITFALRAVPFAMLKPLCNAKAYKPNVGVDARWHLVDFGALNISKQHRR